MNKIVHYKFYGTDAYIIPFALGIFIAQSSFESFSKGNILGVVWLIIGIYAFHILIKSITKVTNK